MKDSIRTLAIASALLVALCMAWFFLLYQPKRTRLSAVQAETQNVVSRIKSFHSTSEDVAKLEQQIDHLRKKLGETRSKVIPKQELGKAMTRLKSQGQKYGLQFQNMIPDYAALVAVGEAGNVNASLVKLPVHIKLRGRYKSFGRYLSSLESLPFLVSFGDLRLAYDEEIVPDIAILFDVVLYLRKDVQSVL